MKIGQIFPLQIPLTVGPPSLLKANTPVVSPAESSILLLATRPVLGFKYGCFSWPLGQSWGSNMADFFKAWVELDFHYGSVGGGA